MGGVLRGGWDEGGAGFSGVAKLLGSQPSSWRAVLAAPPERCGWAVTAA